MSALLLSTQLSNPLSFSVQWSDAATASRTLLGRPHPHNIGGGLCCRIILLNLVARSAQLFSDEDNSLMTRRKRNYGLFQSLNHAFLPGRGRLRGRGPWLRPLTQLSWQSQRGGTLLSPGQRAMQRQCTAHGHQLPPHLICKEGQVCFNHTECWFINFITEIVHGSGLEIKLPGLAWPCANSVSTFGWLLTDAKEPLGLFILVWINPGLVTDPVHLPNCIISAIRQERPNPNVLKQGARTVSMETSVTTKTTCPVKMVTTIQIGLNQLLDGFIVQARKEVLEFYVLAGNDLVQLG